MRPDTVIPLAWLLLRGDTIGLISFNSKGNGHMGFLDRFLGPKKIKDLSPSIQPAQLRKRVKIVVIDDEEESFPYKLLQDDGYTIEWWERVDSHKLQRLENGDFDIIILDIQGVADHKLSSSDGIDVLKRIKSVNKHQIVVAFSGHSYDLSKTAFWRLADDALNKPVTVIKCKELLDRLIQEKITLSNYWNAIVELMRANGVSERTSRRIEKEIVAGLTGQKKVDLEGLRNRVFGSLQNSAAIVTLVDAMVRLWS